MSLFERYLTLWVAALHRRRHRAGAFLPGRLPRRRRGRSGACEPAGRGADLADDHPDADQGRLRRHRRGARALARHRRDAVHQLGGEALLDGGAGLAVHRLPVPALAAGRPDRQLHRRPHPAGGRALHRDGVRVEQPVGRRARLHADAGGAERRDHGRCLRADRGAAARPLRHHRAVADAAAVGRALHRRAGGAGAAHAPRGAGARRAGRPRRACWRACSRPRWSRCWRRWSCCSASRASRSSRSR